MTTPKTLLLALCVSLFAAVVSCSAPKPTVTISPDRMLRGGKVIMRGEGFTPRANVRSHLRRPDGSEFPVLPMMTDERGDFTHEIETFILEPGVYEVWVDDETAKKTSAPVRFEVTRTSVP
jgi:hypothetical protein